MADVLGQFNYFQWKPEFDKVKPYYLYTDPPPGLPNANFSTEPGRPEPVQDVRGREHEYNLDDNAFAFGHQVYPRSLQDLDEFAIKSEYLPSLEVKLREVLQQDCEIFWFDWRVGSMPCCPLYVQNFVDELVEKIERRKQVKATRWYRCQTRE